MKKLRSQFKVFYFALAVSMLLQISQGAVAAAGLWDQMIWDQDVWAEPPKCGDMNGDGNVTNTDAVLIQRHLLGLPSPFNPDLCDVNGDGNCTNTDAVIIKRAVVGLPPGVSQRCSAVVSPL